MKKLRQYSVIWEISELDAKTPLHAAKKAHKWIKEGAQQYYVQDQETKELFSVDLQEEDEYAILLVKDNYIPVIESNLNKKKIYYLFGDTAVRCYIENGIESLLSEIENDYIPFGLFIFIEGETPSIDLLFYANIWDNYAIINDIEYEKLFNLM
jgi:hypothetical protein